MTSSDRARQLASRYPACAEFLNHYAECAEEPASTACPGPHGLPLLAILRPEEHSSRKFFLCSECGHEWETPRMVCPHCGEKSFDKLAIFQAEEFPHIRVDACDTCKRYLLTIDLAKDPDAVPIVDELAATPLNLWAQEQGYSKLQPNLLGL